ncbi:formate dehydrogenase accessory protein FdhE, partial [Escherichia coli]|nr:formate dehydrogenase accessory protein FdhE [Escherichia coli]
HDNPLEMDMASILERSTNTNNSPLDAKTFPRTTHWHKLLTAIIAELMPVVPESVRPALENLNKASETELEAMATALLNEEFEKVPADKSMFI